MKVRKWMAGVVTGVVLALSLGASPAIADEGLSPEEQKEWENHFEGVASALVGGMSLLAKQGIESVAKDLGTALHEVKLALAEPVFKPNVWQRYNDGYYRIYYGGRWWILVNGKVRPN